MLAARPGKSNPPREEAGAVERAAAGSSPGASAIWVRTRRAAGPDGGTRGLPAAVRPAAAPLPSARPQVPGPRSPTAKKPERRTQVRVEVGNGWLAWRRPDATAERRA